MRGRVNGLNGPTLREAGNALRTDLNTARMRLMKDARTAAQAGARRFAEVVRKPAVIAGVAGLVVGALIGWFLKRR